MTTESSAVFEFQKIWKKEYGEDLSYEQVRKEAESLLSLFILLTKP